MVPKVIPVYSWFRSLCGHSGPQRIHSPMKFLQIRSTNSGGGIGYVPYYKKLTFAGNKENEEPKKKRRKCATENVKRISVFFFIDIQAVCTPDRTSKNKSSENLGYRTSPKYISKKPLPNPFLVNHEFETEEEEENSIEFDANLTIVGGKNEWFVDGLNIREHLKEYQNKKNLTKTSPEYYDIILFNSTNDGFLETLDNIIVSQMVNDITDMEKEVKSLLDRIIDRDIIITKENIQNVKENELLSFERKFAFKIQLIEEVNILVEPMSEGTYINSVLAPILNEIFFKNKSSWRAVYGETCLKTSAKDKNSQKYDSERRAPGKKIDVILELRNEKEEFSIIEISGPPLKKDWSHYKGDRLKIAKLLKTMVNNFAEIKP
ncbi:20537_t:CDS:2 [Dentiscutata erythropus]|uniref:20537_t:CDS:1 n=1 Tax=Dentiscutata erythropus TaxID=1348616 RepID=A0A9N9I691_9GLOM|nr:20537_t:CDS:2 [Dentiscutata erythropus]